MFSPGVAKSMRTAPKTPLRIPTLALCFVTLLAVAACDRAGQETKPEASQAREEVPQGLAFPDAPGSGETGAADSLTLRAQVALDRLGFSPGVIDGKEGQSYRLALTGFQEARGLPQSGELDEATQAALLAGQPSSATRRVVIPQAFAREPIEPNLPRDEAAMARYPRLAYRSLTEALSERFHTTPDILFALNGPGTRVGAGRTIRVPDIPNALRAKLDEDVRGWADTLEKLAVSGDQLQADRVVVDKSAGSLRVYGEDDRLLAQFPVTTGSSHDPLPIGTWTVRGEARNPDFQYDPDLFWDAGKHDKETHLPPGPNGPVGVVWIDLSREHYGLHGTPEPKNIGRTESHGCVRLTNWDAARLAQMVKTGTKVIFQE